MVSKQKILIVDDDENIAELVSLYLTKECFDTMMVHDGERALVAFDTYKPNLILLDLMLPGIDGYQVCREIRSKHNTPIIMLSAKGETFDKVLGLELGAERRRLRAEVEAVHFAVLPRILARDEVKIVERDLFTVTLDDDVMRVAAAGEIFADIGRKIDAVSVDAPDRVAHL